MLAREHDLLPSDNLYDQIDRGIKLWDKMLLCCSKAALTLVATKKGE